jgi:hypothetical protein
MLAPVRVRHCFSSKAARAGSLTLDLRMALVLLQIPALLVILPVAA